MTDAADKEIINLREKVNDLQYQLANAQQKRQDSEDASKNREAVLSAVVDKLCATITDMHVKTCGLLEGSRSEDW